MKKWLLLLLFLMPISVNASDITSETSITINGSNIDSRLLDKNYKTYGNIFGDDLIEVNGSNIAGIYIVYYSEVSTGTINNNDKELSVGDNNLIHEYIKLDNTNKFTLKFDENVSISDIYILSEGELPTFVQNWNTPYEEADLLLLSTHGDDEQLFFLGLIPTYINKDIRVQVAYLAHHNDFPRRIHEQLNGLWEIGVRNYPVFGVIPDAYSETLEGAISNLNKVGLDEEFVIKYQTELIRRFKPLVVVGHDELGEYSHGQHILNTHALKTAVERSNDNTYYTDLEYDLWDVKKVYFHLYKDAQITMDYDTPLDKYNGETAYEVSKRGYKMHESQQWTWFTKWINGANNSYTKATEITKYSPLIYGLYKSTVGNDVNKNDMFENITLRKDIKEEVKKTVKKVVNKIRKTSKKDYIIYISVSSIIAIIILICILNRKKR